MAIVVPQPPTGFLGKIDYYIFDLKNSFTDLCQAQQNGDSEGVGDAVLRHVNAHAWFYYFCLNTLRTVSQGVIAFAQEVPHFFSVLENSSFILGTTLCGFVTNAITAVQETIGIMRQSSILSIFRQSSYQEDYLTLAEDIETLTTRYTPAELMARLRPWFVEQERLNSHDRLNKLAAGVRSGEVDAIAEATQLLTNMRTLVIKKFALHIIGLLAVVLSLVGLVGSLFFCPPLFVALFLGAGMLMWNVRCITANGYVDNPDSGFSFIRLLPECIANCFRPNDFMPVAADAE
jgi:hypothetical protein